MDRSYLIDGKNMKYFYSSYHSQSFYFRTNKHRLFYSKEKIKQRWTGLLSRGYFSSKQSIKSKLHKTIHIMFVTSTYLKKNTLHVWFYSLRSKTVFDQIRKIKKDMQMKREKKIILLMYVSLPYILFYFMTKSDANN